MKPISCLAAAAVLLAACGYKGNLYLPKEGDNQKFGPIQTGLEFGKRQPEKPKDGTQPVRFKRTLPPPQTMLPQANRRHRQNRPKNIPPNGARKNENLRKRFLPGSG